MSSRRKNQRLAPIVLSDIRHDSTCITLKLPINLACELCAKKLDIHSFTRKSKKVKERHKNKRNRCAQFWDSHWANDKNALEGNILKHRQTRSYLNIQQDIEINYYLLCDRNKIVDQEINQKRKSNMITKPINTSDEVTLHDRNQNETKENNLSDASSDCGQGPTNPPSDELLPDCPTHTDNTLKQFLEQQFPRNSSSITSPYKLSHSGKEEIGNRRAMDLAKYLSPMIKTLSRGLINNAICIVEEIMIDLKETHSQLDTTGGILNKDKM